MAGRRQRPHRSGSAASNSSEPLVATTDRSAGALLLLVPAGLALLCLAIYSNSFDAGFALDNKQLILNDSRVHAFTRENLALIFQRSYWWPYGESGLYRPLTTLTYLFNFAVLGNGSNPVGYHWFNLLIHIANVLMLGHLTRQITSSMWTGVVAAAIWAASPLSTEAVTNIVGRADLMAATGCLGALLLYVCLRDLPGAASSPGSPGLPGPPGPAVFLSTALLRVAFYIGLVVAIAFGVLAKESAIAAVGVIAVYEWCWWKPGSLRSMLTALVVCAIPLVAWALQRSAVLAHSGSPEFPFTDNPIVGASFGQSRLTAVMVMWRYLTLLAWPARLSNDYSFAQIPLAADTLAEWIGVGLLVVGAILGLVQLRAHRAALFFALFALVTFLPASNLLFASGTIMGERLVYLPSAGLAALVALALDRVSRSTTIRAVATFVAVAIVASYGVRTFARNADWRSDLTVWRSAVIAAPASAKAHRALAEALYDSDPTHANLDQVIAEADKSVALLDALPDNRNTFQAFRQAGAYYLDKANRVSPSAGAADAESRRLYLRAENLLTRAVAIARAGSSQLPGGSVEPEADAERLLAVALLGAENPAAALDAANRARLLSPLNALAYRLAAAGLLGQQRSDDAAVMFLMGSIVSGDAALGQEAMSLYRSGLDTEGCAVLGSGTNSVLNPRCAIVQRHSCTASAAAYQILKRAGQPDRAEQIRQSATRDLRCSADIMDRPNALVP